MPHPFYFQGNPVEIGSNPPETETPMDWLVITIAAMVGASLGAFLMVLISNAARQRELDEIAEAQYYLFAENVKGSVDERH